MRYKYSVSINNGVTNRSRVKNNGIIELYCNKNRKLLSKKENELKIKD